MESVCVYGVNLHLENFFIDMQSCDQQIIVEMCHYQNWSNICAGYTTAFLAAKCI